MKKERDNNFSIPPETEKLGALRDLIKGFNESTRKLSKAYASLQKKFERLNLKLEETNKELTESLKDKEKLSRYLNDILESLASGVIVVNLNGKITLVNRRAEEIIGKKASEVIGEDYFDIMGMETPSELTPFHTLKAQKPIIEGEKTLVNSSGQRIPIAFSTSLVTDDEHSIIGAVESFRDISELKRLEDEVNRMNTLAALGQMAATVAHEIRNPLGGIAGFANLLERDLKPDDDRRRLVKKIIEGVSGLNKIVTGLLTYTREIKLVTHPIDFISHMDEIINYFEIDVNGEEDIFSIIRNYQVETLPCAIDPEQFQQVILNFLYNAVQAMSPTGGDIEVVISDKIHGIRPGLAKNLNRRILRKIRRSSRVFLDGGPLVFFSISDDGNGMPAETLSRLFTPFFTTKESGTGLGLVAAKKIVEAHRGEIFVESEPNGGSVFSVVFPAS